MSKFIVAQELQQFIHDVCRSCLYRYSIAVLHAEKADGCISIGWMNCELMETLLGCLDVFCFCLASVASGSCTQLGNLEELRVRQRQLSVRASFPINARCLIHCETQALSVSMCF